LHNDANNAPSIAKRWLQAIPSRGEQLNASKSQQHESKQPEVSIPRKDPRHGVATDQARRFEAQQRHLKRQDILLRARQQQMADAAQSGTEARLMHQSFAASPLDISTSRDNLSRGGKVDSIQSHFHPSSEVPRSFVAGVALGSSFLSGSASEMSSHMHASPGPRVVQIPRVQPADSVRCGQGARATTATVSQLPLLSLEPLQDTFNYKSKKATVRINPQSGWIWGVFHDPRRWFAGVLRRQESTMQRLEVEVQCSTRLEGLRAAKQLQHMHSTREGVLQLLKCTLCIHLRVKSGGGAAGGCAIQLALSPTAAPESLEEHSMPIEHEIYQLPQLPKWSHKLYKYLLKLLLAVKARTPLLILTGPKGRTALMANLPQPDVACKLTTGWKVQYTLRNQRMTLQCGPSSAVLSLARADCDSAAAASGETDKTKVDVAILKQRGDTLSWGKLTGEQADELMPTVRHTQGELFSALRLWERVLSTRDSIQERIAQGASHGSDKELIRSLSTLPVILKQPSVLEAAPMSTPLTTDPVLLKVTRAKRRRQGGIKVHFNDGAIARISSDGLTYYIQPGNGNHNDSEQSVDTSFLSSSTISNSECSAAWSTIASAPTSVARYMDMVGAFLRARKARASETCHTTGP
jgi:hypothetical protein